MLISTVFIDKSTRVSPSVLPLLYQTERVGHYSWASAILACLYRGLGEGTRMFAKRTDGATFLHQVFSSITYEKIHRSHHTLTLTHIVAGLDLAVLSPPRSATSDDRPCSVGGPPVCRQVPDDPPGTAEQP